MRCLSRCHVFWGRLSCGSLLVVTCVLLIGIKIKTYYPKTNYIRGSGCRVLGAFRRTPTVQEALEPLLATSGPDQQEHSCASKTVVTSGAKNSSRPLNSCTPCPGGPMYPNRRHPPKPKVTIPCIATLCTSYLGILDPSGALKYVLTPEGAALRSESVDGLENIFMKPSACQYCNDAY